MPPKAKDKGGASATRPSTRRTVNSVLMPEELQDIKDAEGGRKFLEKHSLLCPPGEPVTNTALAICLHQISALSGVPKQTVNVIRATDFLLEEIEEFAIKEMVREALNSQLMEFMADMKTLVEDAKAKIDGQFSTAMEQITKVTKATPPPIEETRTKSTRTAGPSYAAALINPPPHVNPKMVAREGIKARQFLITGESAYGQYDTQQLKVELNKVIKDYNETEGRIRSVSLQRDGNHLIEVDSDNLAKWFANGVNRAEFCSFLGDDIAFKTRVFNVLAFNILLNLDTRNINH